MDTLFPPSVFYLLRLSDEEAESRRCWLDRYMNRLAQSLDISTKYYCAHICSIFLINGYLNVFALSARAFELLMDFFGADEIGVEGRVHGKLSVST